MGTRTRSVGRMHVTNTQTQLIQPPFTPLSLSYSNRSGATSTRPCAWWRASSTLTPTRARAALPGGASSVQATADASATAVASVRLRGTAKIAAATDATSPAAAPTASACQRGRAGGTRARARQGGTAMIAAYAFATAIAATQDGATTVRVVAATAAPTSTASVVARCRRTRSRSTAPTSAWAAAPRCVPGRSVMRWRTQPPPHLRRERGRRASWVAMRTARRSACVSVRRSSGSTGPSPPRRFSSRMLMACIHTSAPALMRRSGVVALEGAALCSRCAVVSERGRAGHTGGIHRWLCD